MLLTITTTAPQATDLGYLLHKNPASLFEREISFGRVRVFYTEATEERCTIALQVEVDPIGLVRGKGEKRESNPLAQYVSTRPYIPSSFLSVAMNEAFRSALNGQTKERWERVTEKLPLVAQVFALEGEPGLIRQLFAPLGYTVDIVPVGLRDERFPEWGDSGLIHLTLTGEVTVRDLLTHLYVLIPVLDNAKHYYIGEDEVEKLVRRGEGWLASHPDRERIARRYLPHRRRLADAALERLVEVEESVTPETVIEQEEAATVAEETLGTTLRLNDLRIEATVAAVQALEPPAHRVIDLGCGEGRTLTALRKLPQLTQIAGMDVSPVSAMKTAKDGDNRPRWLSFSAVSLCKTYPAYARGGIPARERVVGF